MSRYVVVDLEMCDVPRGFKRESYGTGKELIQIGAVLIDDNEIVNRFETFVHPEHGEIDRFIEKLTGITRKDVKDAPNADTALKRFFDWAPDDAKMVSWSMSDRAQIETEIEKKEIFIPGVEKYLENWIDCQEIFDDRLDMDHSYNLSEALNITNIDYDENVHNASADAYNTALLFIKLMTEDELELSPYFVRYQPLGHDDDDDWHDDEGDWDEDWDD